LVAVAALVSPVIAVIGTVVAAFVSYRAVTTGPRIQREIAREQFALTSRQLALQERTAVANLLGAADQRWIEDFRETVAELVGLVIQLMAILLTQKHDVPHFEVEKVREHGARLDPLIAKIGLMVGAEGQELVSLIEAWQHPATESPQATTNWAHQIS